MIDLSTERLNALIQSDIFLVVFIIYMCSLLTSIITYLFRYKYSLFIFHDNTYYVKRHFFNISSKFLKCLGNQVAYFMTTKDKSAVEQLIRSRNLEPNSLYFY